MSVQALFLKIQPALEVIKAFNGLQDLLTELVRAEQLANAAKVEAEKQKALTEKLKLEAEDADKKKKDAEQAASLIIEEAHKQSREANEEAKRKTAAASAKAAEKLKALEAEIESLELKFNLDKENKAEIIAMLGAQIAHGEAKLSEIRAAVASATAMFSK
jgi:hypothetical protein